MVVTDLDELAELNDLLRLLHNYLENELVLNTQVSDTIQALIRKLSAQSEKWVRRIEKEYKEGQ